MIHSPRGRVNYLEESMTRDIQKEITDEINANPIIVYMKGTQLMPQCGFSAQVVQILHALEVPFKDINILADPEKRQGIKDFSEWPTLPQLYVAGEFIGGSDIVRDLYEKGELEAIVKKALT